MASNKSGYGFLIKWLVVLGDLLLINFLFFLTYEWIKTYGSVYHQGVNWRYVYLLLNFSYIFAVYFIPVKIYQPVMFIDKVIQHSFSLIALHAVIFIACLFFLNLENDILPLSFIIYYYLLLFVIFTTWRVLAREILKIYRRKGRNYRRVIIVGAGKNGIELFAKMKKEITYGYNVYGFFDDNLSLKNTLPNYLGMTYEVEDFVLKNDIDEIYCTLPSSQDEKITRILNFAEKHMVHFYIVPEFSRYVKKRMDLDIIESIPVMAIRSEPLQSVHNQIIKRIFDIVFSFCFLVVLFPALYVIFGILIKLSSSGPIIFKQRRTGIYGKSFDCYKFRSMKLNKDADTKQAEKDDPRTTKIGQFLRHYNLDEIPQFYNVLIGDMSVIGPRPHMIKHTELYSSFIDKYMVRHLIKPGITGWAQVNGYRGETITTEQMEGRVRCDVWYLENWSFILDLKILITTILNMFLGEKNAY